MKDNFNAQAEIQRLKDDFHDKSDNKVCKSTFYWSVGGLAAAMLSLFYYTHNRIDQLIMHSNDHDKIIKLETELAHLKK